MLRKRGITLGVYMLFFLLPLVGYSKTKLYAPTLYDRYPWAFSYYYGVTASDPLARILETEFHRWPEHIQSLELTHVIPMTNPVRRFFYPIVSVVQLSANVTMRNGSHQPVIYEFDPHITFRWANFPWNHVVNTSFALAEGISYVTSVPTIEKRQNDFTKRLLNFLIIETTFAIPKDPRFQLFFRIHHRSGAYGLYHAGNTGSNDVAMGLRYLF